MDVFSNIGKHVKVDKGENSYLDRRSSCDDVTCPTENRKQLNDTIDRLNNTIQSLLTKVTEKDKAQSMYEVRTLDWNQEMDTNDSSLLFKLDELDEVETVNDENDQSFSSITTTSEYWFDVLEGNLMQVEDFRSHEMRRDLAGENGRLMEEKVKRQEQELKLLRRRLSSRKLQSDSEEIDRPRSPKLPVENLGDGLTCSFATQSFDIVDHRVSAAARRNTVEGRVQTALDRVAARRGSTNEEDIMQTVERLMTQQSSTTSEASTPWNSSYQKWLQVRSDAQKKREEVGKKLKRLQNYFNPSASYDLHSDSQTKRKFAF